MTPDEYALPIRASKSVTIGQVVETDTAMPLGSSKSKRIGQAVETDTALPITVGVTVVGPGVALVYHVVEPHPHLEADDPVMYGTEAGLIAVLLVVGTRIYLRKFRGRNTE